MRGLPLNLKAKRRSFNAVQLGIKRIEEEQESVHKQAERDRLARVNKAGILKAAFQI